MSLIKKLLQLLTFLGIIFSSYAFAKEAKKIDKTTTVGSSSATCVTG